MAFRFILLVLPALALASIEVEISGKYSRDGKDLKLHYKGDDIRVISDTERTTFNLNDDSLKDAVKAYFGKRPEHAAVSDLNFFAYRVLDSEYQVYRKLVPRSGKIYRVSWRPTVVVYQTFENNSTLPVTFNVGISQSVANTVWSSWSKSGELTGIKIKYGNKIKVTNIDKEASFNYTSSWGQDTEQSQTVTVGASSNIDITLQPGQAVVARLDATRGFVTVEMVYDAFLYGYTAVRYYDWYKGTYFHIIDINLCMKSAGISNQKTSRELVDIEYFTDSKVVISDLRRGDILMEVH